MKMKLLTCFLTSCLFATAHAQTSTGYPYYEMSSNQAITYQVYSFTGAYNPSGGTIGVNPGTQTLTANSPQQHTYSSTTCALFGQLWQGGASAPLYVDNYHDSNGNLTGTITNGGGVSGTKNYIGEAVSQTGNVTIPFEAKITQYPVAGEVIDIKSVVYSSCAGNPSSITNSSYHWTYMTVEHLNQWGPFTDVWVTSLYEHNTQTNPANKDEVYNYYFAKNIGLVDLYYGHLNADNSISDGTRYYAISY